MYVAHTLQAVAAFSKVRLCDEPPLKTWDKIRQTCFKIILAHYKAPSKYIHATEKDTQRAPR